MTPEEHYAAAEAHIDEAAQRTDGFEKTWRYARELAELRLRAAEVGAQLRERWGHDELAKMEAATAYNVTGLDAEGKDRWIKAWRSMIAQGRDVAERPLDEQRWPGVHYAPAAARRTARALDAVKAVTVGWARGQYADKLDAFDAVRAIIDGQSDGPGAPDDRTADVVTDQLNDLLSNINGTLHELDRIIGVYTQRMDTANAAQERAYGRGIEYAVQRVREAMDRGQ